MTSQATVKFVASGAQSTVNVLTPDDTIIAWGDDNDAVFYLSSSAVSADAEITNVIEGTSDHQGVAADSLIISNVTNDGDIIMLVSDGGNSKEFLLANADTADLQLGHGMATVTIKTASGDLTLSPGGAVSLANNALNNVGHASSDWDSTSLRSAVDVFVADGVGMVIGHTALLSMDGVGSEFQLHGTATPDSNMMLSSWRADDPGPQITFGKSRATTINDWGGTDSQVHNGDMILNFTCYVDDGTTTPERTARVLCLVDDADPQTNAVGTKWVFETTTTSGTATTALVIDAAQDVTIPNGSIAMGVVSDPSTVTDSAHIYVKDDPAEVYVRDEAGNVTKISPHNDIGEWEFHSYNNKTGKSFKVNMEHMIRKLEDITGESFIQEDIHA